MLSVNFLFPEIMQTADNFRRANAITYLFSRCEGNISLTSNTLKILCDFIQNFSKNLLT